jgi:hypothetical protein
MSSSEHELPMSPGGSPLPPAAERPPRHAKRVGWWVRGALGLAVVVALLAVILLVRAAHGPAATGWQTYRDPLGLFTVGVPPGWTAQGGQSGRLSFGGPAGSVSEVPEGVTVTNPAHGTGSGYVSIFAYYVPPAFVNGDGLCRYFGAAAYGPFPGPPWRLTPYRGTWLVDTQNAHFQIDSAVPDVFGPLPGTPLYPPPTPTPVPARWVALDEPVVNAALASFQPAARPVSSCPGPG